MEDGRTRAQPRQRAALAYSRSRDTRSALIRAAMRLWDNQDFNSAFEATTAADIAGAAGVSKGTFYFHFPNKEAILLELSSATIEEMTGLVNSASEKGIRLRVLSERVVSLLARRVVQTPKAAALRAAAVGFTARTDGALDRAGLAVAFESLIRYGVEQGELSPDLDVSETAAMMTAVFAEAIIRWGRADRSATWLRKTFQNRLAVMLRGVGLSELDSS